MAFDSEWVACDICGSYDSEVIYTKGRGDVVQNVVCKQCGLVYVNPREPEGQIEDQYLSGEFSLSARNAALPDSAKLSELSGVARRRYKVLRKFTGGKAGRLLEIGCSVGAFLDVCQQDGWRVVGYEPDPECARFGSEKFGVDIRPEVFRGKAGGADGKFDAVTMFHVIEHLSSPRKTLGDIYRLLDDDGLLVLENPAIDEPYGGDLNHFFWKPHIYSFSSKTLPALLGDIGFEVIDISFYAWFMVTVARKTPGWRKPIVYPIETVEEVKKKLGIKQ